MQLHPKRQPGRTDRKAAAYAAEITRLRSAGYTYEAIREALADVNIVLSTSTLRREMRRSLRRTNTAPTVPQRPSPAPVNTPPLPSPVRAPHPAPPPGASGREIAEAYFSTHPSNPLLRTQEVP